MAAVANVFRVSQAHEEGGDRVFSISTKRLLGEAGRVTGLETVQVELKTVDGRARFEEVPGTETVYPADLVLLAMGFSGPEPGGMLDQLGVTLDRVRQRPGRRRPPNQPSPRSSPPATWPAARASSSGPSPRAATPPARSTSS